MTVSRADRHDAKRLATNFSIKTAERFADDLAEWLSGSAHRRALEAVWAGAGVQFTSRGLLPRYRDLYMSTVMEAVYEATEAGRAASAERP